MTPLVMAGWVALLSEPRVRAVAGVAEAERLVRQLRALTTPRRDDGGRVYPRLVVTGAEARRMLGLPPDR